MVDVKPADVTVSGFQVLGESSLVAFSSAVARVDGLEVLRGASDRVMSKPLESAMASSGSTSHSYD